MGTTPIVAVASSAGDMDAVSELLAAFPDVCGAAFVVVQHHDAGAREILVRRLAAGNDFPGASGSRRRCAGAGPGLRDGRRHHADDGSGPHPRDTQSQGLHQPGDILFTSLAEQCGDRAIGVVLSGTGRTAPVAFARSVKWRDRAGAVPRIRPFSQHANQRYRDRLRAVRVAPNEIARELTRLSGYMRPTPHPRTAGMVAPRPEDPNPQTVGHGGGSIGTLR